MRAITDLRTYVIYYDYDYLTNYYIIDIHLNQLFCHSKNNITIVPN